jgi:hypothetical protein
MAREPDKTDEHRLAIEPTIPALPESFSSEGRPPAPVSSGSLPYVVVGLVVAVAVAFFWLSGGRAPAPAPAAAPPAAAAKPPVAAKPAPVAPKPAPVAAKPAPVAAPTPTIATAEPTHKRAPKHHKKAHAKKHKDVKLPRLPNPPPAD